jgi:hypothetical protein
MTPSMEKKTKQALIHVPTCVRFSVESQPGLVKKKASNQDWSILK